MQHVFNNIVLAHLMLMTVKGDDSISFLLLGDWGKGGNSGNAATGYSDENRMLLSERAGRNLGNNQGTNQAAVAKAMGSYSAEHHPSFIVALGDNFYTKGVSSSTDEYWETLWSNVYLDYYPYLKVSWFPVFGKL
jgi:hypothetical protein